MMNVNMSGNGGVSAMTSSDPSAMPAVSGVRLNSTLLAGSSVNVSWNVADPVTNPTAVLLSMMESYFHALEVTAKNLGTSEEMRELLKRKQEELEELMRDLKNQKIDYEQARITFMNCVASEEDKAYFEKILSEMRAVVVA